MSDAKVLPIGRERGKPALDKPILSARGLTFCRGGRTLLNDVSFDLHAAGVTALLGPNGAGKSLTMRLLAGMIFPDRGEIVAAPEVRGRIGLVFQKPVMLRRTVRGVLDHALRIAHVPRRERVGRIAELLVMGNLTRHAESPARALSGGEQQRLALVRALVREPRLLLLDEPTSSLDISATKAFESLLQSVTASGTKIMFTSHDWLQARRLASDVVFLFRGQVSEQTPAEVFFESPGSALARDYRDGKLN